MSEEVNRYKLEHGLANGANLKIHLFDNTEHRGIFKHRLILRRNCEYFRKTGFLKPQPYPGSDRFSSGSDVPYIVPSSS